MKQTVVFCVAVITVVVLVRSVLRDWASVDRVGEYTRDEWMAEIKSDRKASEEQDRILAEENRIIDEAKRAADLAKEDEKPDDDEDKFQDPLCRNRLNPRRFIRK